MMIWLITIATVLFAGYNLLIKLSGNAVTDNATSTILATLTLQLTAVAVSCCFLSVQLLAGGHSFKLGLNAYLWAAGAGVCIAGAEIAYLYLFGGLGGGHAPASLAIPVIVGGTVLISAVVGVVLLGEHLTRINWLGVGLMLIGLILVVHNHR